MPVTRSGGEERLEKADVRRDSQPRSRQPRGETLFQVPGGGVKGTVKSPRIPIEGFAVRPRVAANIDELEPRTRLDLEAQFNGIWSYRRKSLALTAETTSAGPTSPSERRGPLPFVDGTVQLGGLDEVRSFAPLFGNRTLLDDLTDLKSHAVPGAAPRA